MNAQSHNLTGKIYISTTGTSARADAPVPAGGLTARRICSWCKLDMGPAQTTQDTHGICGKCQENLLNKLNGPSRKDPMLDGNDSAAGGHAVREIPAGPTNFSGGGTEASRAGSVADGLAPSGVLSTVKPASCRSSVRPAAEFNLPVPAQPPLPSVKSALQHCADGARESVRHSRLQIIHADNIGGNSVQALAAGKIFFTFHAPGWPVRVGV